MLVQNWMTGEVVSVTPDTTLLKLGKLMRDKKVLRLPVVDDNEHVVGIISDRDVRDASPSKATSLDMYEIVKALEETGFDGYVRPDHGRMIWGEEGRPGYGLYDRALGAAYLNG